MKNLFFYILTVILVSSLSFAQEPQVLSLVSNFVPNEKEETLDGIFQNSFEEGGDQEREVANRNRYLDLIARKLAKDRIERDWLESKRHVDPDGHGPDWHLIQMGWSLPSQWINVSDISTYTESFVGRLGGFMDPDKAWEWWMNSEGHRKHLLGLDPRSKMSTSYGIGVYDGYKEKLDVWGFPYNAPRSVFVFIAAPPDPNFPDLGYEPEEIPGGTITVTTHGKIFSLIYSTSGSFSAGVYHIEKSSDLSTWNKVETKEFSAASTETIETKIETEETSLYFRVRRE